MTMLLNGEQGIPYRQNQRQEKEPRKPLSLPSQNSDMRRTFAYLIKERYQDRQIITVFAKAGLIYESLEDSRDKTKQYHNAIFVGRDKEGVARHAHKKGIYTYGLSYLQICHQDILTVSGISGRFSELIAGRRWLLPTEPYGKCLRNRLFVFQPAFQPLFIGETLLLISPLITEQLVAIRHALHSGL